MKNGKKIKVRFLTCFALLGMFYINSCSNQSEQPVVKNEISQQTQSQPAKEQPAPVEPVKIAKAPEVKSTSPATGGWKWCGWGGGGFFHCAAWHPVNENIIIMGGDVAGMYKTEDKGKNWRLSNKGISHYGVFSVAFSKTSPDTVYVMTLDGINKSTDCGETWKILPQTQKANLDISSHRPLSVRAVAVDPANSAIVYAGTKNGKLFKSTDEGENWSELKYLSQGAEKKDAASEKTKNVVTSVAVANGNPKRIIVSTSENGIFLSEDAGMTWKACESPKKTMCVTISQSDEKIAYAACAQDGVFKTVDGGATWQKTGEGIDAKAVVREVYVYPQDPNKIRCIGSKNGWNGVFYSSNDGGAKWEAQSGKIAVNLDENPTIPTDGKYAAGLSDLKNISGNPVHPEEIFIAGNWRNIFSSEDGKNWQERSKGADISCIEDIQFFNGKTYAVVMDEGLLTSSNGGETWKQLIPLKYTAGISGHQWRVRLIKNNTGGKIISTLSPWTGEPNRILISEDGGKNFKVVTQGLPNYISYKNCMWGRSYPRALAVDPNNPETMYLGMDGDPEQDKGKPGNGIFKSTDGGNSWKLLPNQPKSHLMFFGLEVDPTDSKRVFWGGNKENGGLYRSEDGGESWKKVFDKETMIWNVMITKSGTIYCGNDNLWKSVDHGNTWQKVSDFNDKLAIVGITHDPENENKIWVSKVAWGETAAGGVQKTEDGGKTWKDITGNLEAMYRKPLILRYNKDSHELWAAGVGIFKIKE